jgi:hypothetical protein
MTNCWSLSVDLMTTSAMGIMKSAFLTTHNTMSNILLSRLITYADKIIGITSVDFIAVNQLLIK